MSYAETSRAVDPVLVTHSSEKRARVSPNIWSTCAFPMPSTFYAIPRWTWHKSPFLRALRTLIIFPSFSKGARGYLLSHIEKTVGENPECFKFHATLQGERKNSAHRKILPKSHFFQTQLFKNSKKGQIFRKICEKSAPKYLARGSFPVPWAKNGFGIYLFYT